jgi:hypothetical protein
MLQLTVADVSGLIALAVAIGMAIFLRGAHLSDVAFPITQASVLQTCILTIRFLQCN